MKLVSGGSDINWAYPRFVFKEVQSCNLIKDSVIKAPVTRYFIKPLPVNSCQISLKQFKGFREMKV